MVEAGSRPLRPGRVALGCLIAWLVGSLLAPPVLYAIAGGAAVQGKSGLDLIALWPFMAMMTALYSAPWMVIFALPLALLAAPQMGNRPLHNAVFGAVAGGGLFAVLDAASEWVVAQGTWPVAALFGAATGYFVTRRYHG